MVILGEGFVAGDVYIPIAREMLQLNCQTGLYLDFESAWKIRVGKVEVVAAVCVSEDNDRHRGNGYN